LRREVRIDDNTLDKELLDSTNIEKDKLLSWQRTREVLDIEEIYKT